MQWIIFVIPSVKKSSGGGMQGGTLNCQGFLCKQKLFPINRPRRPAGRDPTARRWSPKAKVIKPLRRAAFPGLTSFTSCSRACGMKCICSFSCLANSRVSPATAGCLSWLRCIFWLRLCRAKLFMGCPLWQPVPFLVMTKHNPYTDLSINRYFRNCINRIHD